MKCRTRTSIAALLAGWCMGWLSAAAAPAQEEFLPPPDDMASPMPAPVESTPYYSGMPDGAWANGGGPMMGGAPCYDCGDCGYGCGGCARPLVTPPFWEAHVSTVIMHRELLSETTLVTQDFGNVNNTPPARPILRSADYNTEWEVGGDISLMLNDFWGGMVELRTMWFDDFSDVIRKSGDDLAINTATRVNPNPPPLIIPNNILNPPIPPTVVGFNDPQNLASLYASEFASVELNYKERISHRVTVVAGLRYINLAERLDIDIEGNGLPEQELFMTWLSNNDCFGAQLGLEFQMFTFCDSPWEIRGKALFAGFYNDSRGNFSFVTRGLTPDQAGQGNDRGPSGDGVFLGEFGVKALYHWNPHVSLHVGYDLLYLDGVVLASELPSTTAQFANLERVPMILNSGTVIFHGAVLGVDFRY